MTRQELGWLLAQEARGAARTLRAEVSELRASLPPKRTGEQERTSSLPVERSLNALDEAIALLGKLETGTKSRPRRGRIDLAALLFEVAPECRIEMAPGAGTEVIGDEHELRRMLHLLLSNQGGMTDTQGVRAVGIRREGSWIKVTVELGPDAGATTEVERRWISRMAVRYGGKFELHGRQQSVLLPAETSSREEVDGLRRELFEAQQLGETYARELATVLGGGLAPTAPQATGAASSTRLDILRAFAAGLLPTLQHLVGGGSGSGSMAPSAGSEAADAGLRDTLGELTALVALRSGESRRVDLRSSIHAALARCSRRAQRRGVQVVVGALAPCPVDANAELLDVLVRNALEHAISASPAEWQVRLDLELDGGEATLALHDGGPPVPPHVAGEFLNNRVEPGSLGRPAGIALLICYAALESLGGTLEFRSAERGNVTLLRFPAAT